MDVTDKNLMVAFEHLDRNVPARDILELLCFNSGGEHIEARGKVTKFNPLIHRDLEGGIAPGDKVKVVDVGMVNPKATRRTVSHVSSDGVNVEEKVTEETYRKVISRATVRRFIASNKSAPPVDQTINNFIGSF